MATNFALCVFHQKPTKFICTNPCNTQFCTDCANFHRNHIIRDLVTFPLTPELASLTTTKSKILKNIEKLDEKVTNSQKTFKILDDHKTRALEKTDESFKLAQNRLNTKMKSVKTQIALLTSEKKQILGKYIQKCEEKRSEYCKKLEIIDLLTKAQPEYIVKFVNLLDPDLGPTEKILKPPEFSPIEVPLLSDAGAFFASI